MRAAGSKENHRTSLFSFTGQAQHDGYSAHGGGSGGRLSGGYLQRYPAVGA